MLSDLLGPQLLKGTSITHLGMIILASWRRYAFAPSLRVMQSRRDLYQTPWKLCILCQKSEIPNPEFGIILGALSKSNFETWTALDVEDSINIITTQILSDYLEVDEDGFFWTDDDTEATRSIVYEWAE